MNLSVPEKERDRTDPVFTPWPHVDQSPLRPNLQCIQGILNLLPNGPDDGGLMVLEGSSKFYTELWEAFHHKSGEKGWNTWEMQFVDKEMCQWLESNGCRWHKVCAGPGDLLLWDSVSLYFPGLPLNASNSDLFLADRSLWRCSILNQ